MFRLAFAALVALALAATDLTAQDTARSPAGSKSPTAARVIGIVPGAGHVYAGEVGRGLQHFGVTVGTLMLASLMLAADCTGSENCDDIRPAVAMLAGLGYWGWSIYDAGHAAERANARRRWSRMSLIAAPIMPTLTGANAARALKLGLSFRTH